MDRGAWNKRYLITAIRNDGFKRTATQEHYRCDQIGSNAPDPIRTPQLSVLGRE